MLKKSFNKKQNTYKVTFRFEPESDVETVQLLGDFNEWGQKKQHFLKKRKNGSYSLTLSLKPQQSYEYRYFIDDKQWVTDTSADSIRWNIFGSQNSVVSIDSEENTNLEN